MDAEDTFFVGSHRVDVLVLDVECLGLVCLAEELVFEEFIIVIDVKSRLVTAVLVYVSTCLMCDQILLAWKLLQMRSYPLIRLLKHIRAHLLALLLQRIVLVLSISEALVRILQLLARLPDVAIVDLILLEELLIHRVVFRMIQSIDLIVSVARVAPPGRPRLLALLALARSLVVELLLALELAYVEAHVLLEHAGREPEVLVRLAIVRE